MRLVLLLIPPLVRLTQAVLLLLQLLLLLLLLWSDQIWTSKSLIPRRQIFNSVETCTAPRRNSCSWNLSLSVAKVLGLPLSGARVWRGKHYWRGWLR